jgi:hypothetical protein
MSADLLVGWGKCFILIQYSKCNSGILHLLPYRILPNIVYVLLVKYHAFLPLIWDFNTKLVSPFVISLGDGSYDAAALLEHIQDPP